jgi:hypothetical protein
MRYDLSLTHELWNSIVMYGERTREGNMNGLERWNFLKELIPNVKIQWNKLAKKIYDDLGKLGVNHLEELESGLSHIDWERQHFLSQHGRIIYKNPEGTLVRLYQIAFNIGQFKVEARKKLYTEEQMKYYKENKLDQYDTYVEPWSDYEL